MFKFGSKRDLRTGDLRCTIKLLNDNEVLDNVEFTRETTGQVLLDRVFTHLNLIETDYFGLQFIDDHSHKVWLDPIRAVYKQIKGLDSVTFNLRVKFYPMDPNRVKEELTRYLIQLQLRRDLVQGRLTCTQQDLVFLMACVVQSELGDYDPEEHTGNYVASLGLNLSQNAKLEEEVMTLHQTELKGQSPAQAEMSFLKRAIGLETYGIDPIEVKDQKGTRLHLGVNYSGVLVFQGNRKITHYVWKEIQKITYEGRMCILHVLVNEKKVPVGYKCSSTNAVHNLWRSMIEQRYFFTMSSSSEVPSVTTGGSLFSRSTKLRYSGRVERELVNQVLTRRKESSGIKRSASTASAPSGMRTLGRSETLRTPRTKLNVTANGGHESSPESLRNKVLYMNYSAFSDTLDMEDRKNMTHPQLKHMEAFDEEDLDISMASSLPTEFDMRPDLTPTGEESNNLHAFERPQVRGSPSLPTRPDIVRSSHSSESSQPRSKSNSTSMAAGENTATPAAQKQKLVPKLVAVVRTTIISCLLLLVLVSCLFIAVVELDMLREVRKLPEMVLLRREYYEPMKRSLIRALKR